MKNIIKTLAVIALALFAASACVRENGIDGEPYFRVSVGLLDGEPVIEYGRDMQYTYETTYFKYSNSAVGAEEDVSFNFYVNSNCRWRIIKLDDGPEYDWISSFPDEGDCTGRFFFRIARNNDQNNDRSCRFTFTINDGRGEKEVNGILAVHQGKCVDFLKTSAANVEIANTGSKSTKLVVTANVPWTYSLAPLEDYATPDLEWLTDLTVHPADQLVDTLVFSTPDNSAGGIRGALISIDVPGYPDLNKTVNLTQYGADTEIEGFPVRWGVGYKGNNYTSTWPAGGTITPLSGNGLISFNNEIGKSVDVNNKTLFDVSGNCPRVTGVWPGDYCQFEVFAPVSAGSIIKISFETRVSGTGHKFWRLEYRDGSEWKIAGKALTDPEVPGPDGQPVVYTHAMNPDASTNIFVNTNVRYENTTDAVVFRFICAANYQVNGSGPLAQPNGGTWRLANTATSETDEKQPLIQCIAAGGESLNPVNISVSENTLVFEGTPTGPQTVTVSAEGDYTVSTESDWIGIDVTEGAAFEEKTVTVTCQPSTLTKMRRGQIVVKSGVSKKAIEVVQGSAGGEVESFVSFVGGNTFKTNGREHTEEIPVQANVDFVTTSDVEWMKVVESAPASRAAVSVTPVPVSFEANHTGAERVGHLTVTAGNYVAVLTVTQEVYEEEKPKLLHAEWLLSAATMSDYTSTFGVQTKDAGDGGAYVNSNVSPGGKIRYFQVDKNAVDAANNAQRTVGSTGHPFVYGAWEGDYWLFEASDGKTYPAGTKVHIYFITRISAEGMKYWKLEYYDGQAWQPASELKTVTLGGTDVKYNFEPITASPNSTVDVTWTLAAACDNMQFRYTCVSNYNFAGVELTETNHHTCRIAGAAGTSPIFEVIE